MESAAFDAPYGYIPTKYVTIIFLILFSISTIAHARKWGSLPLLVWPILVCGMFEIMGWASRLANSISPQKITPFELQLVATLVGPTPLAHASVNLLQALIDILDDPSSIILPISTWIFSITTSCSITATFLIQIVGGSLAAVAFRNGGNPSKGGHLMYVGTILHLATLGVQCLFAVYSFIRYLRRGGEAWRSLRIEILGLVVSIACVLARASYRVAELSGGFGGRLATIELYFNVLDGTMMLVAMVILNYVVPRSIGFLRATREVTMQSMQDILLQKA